jgi:crotonobetainyl-CoA:carnitine CoA-transferase CaiB-like acyl-CoA transferase
VISIRGEDDWRALSTIIGLSGAADGMRWATAESRRERREELINIVSQWTRVRSATAVAELLQGVGVAAAEVNRATDVLRDPQVLHRGLYAEMAHPLVDIPLPSETGPAPYRNIPRADLRPAPLLGEHTRDICQQMLGLDVEQIDRLIDERVLFAPQVPSPVAGRSTAS